MGVMVAEAAEKLAGNIRAMGRMRSDAEEDETLAAPASSLAPY